MILVYEVVCGCGCDAELLYHMQLERRDLEKIKDVLMNVINGDLLLEY